MPRSLKTNRGLKILIHGYGGLGIDYAIKNVTAAYKLSKVPVIIVDWSMISSIPCYPTAFFNTWHVGQCTAILTVSLAKAGIPPNKIHVIGFSLGAHIASFASNQLQKTLGVPYHRITGLDPALPFFATLVNEWKLDPSDAPFVDVIHTSAGSFGKLEAIGHVDFYINGGAMQPNCINANYPQLCSHVMAGTYYASTIRNKKFFGYACPSILHYTLGFCSFENATGVLMGEHVDRKARGIYFVETTNPLRFRALETKT
ncbi:pancreatic triacylglycerol lipase-like [Atheta coriaria]|uniref:pancreatic triacylglycerol lipase-like n=1 Tax=Dalotia coriaria TaxID=877792 RepID=UPI0031F43FDC